MDDLHRWLCLQHCRHIGVAAAQQLLTHFGTIDNALAATTEQLTACGINARAVTSLMAGADEQAIERDLQWAAKPGNHLIPLSSERYPARLRGVNAAPLILYVRGDPDVLHTPQLAMVGSRRPSSSGRETAQDFARYLAGIGITITSGMAIGIDAASHLGALRVGGLTIAVAATGPDRLYPARHRELAGQITAEGAIISEFPVGTAVRPEYFPRRNRIISGLSIGTLVVEAATRSGSLTTAHHAMEQGREVFAIPGSIRNPMARGCHALIRQGARLVETPQDVVEELSPQLATAWPASPITSVSAGQNDVQPNPVTDPTYQRLIGCLDYEPQDIDKLVERSGHSAAEIASMLLMLELNGHVRRSEGNKYARV